MKKEPADASTPLPAQSPRLERALSRSRKIKAAIKGAASKLASATEVLKLRKTVKSSPRSVERAISQYEEVEGEVLNAAHDLTRVNVDLEVEVAERVGIESQLAETRADLADMKVDLASARDDLSESQASEREALHLALHDRLTRLPNRTLFDEGLDHGLIQARRHGWLLAVLFIDVDDFKSINDSYGHQVGDEVLLMIAERLQSFVRAGDLVSRWGGDEYACLLLEIRQEVEAVHLAQRMIERIAEEFVTGTTTLSVQCSVGIATYPGCGESADVLLKNADEAMYRAKGTSEKVVLFG